MRILLLVCFLTFSFQLEAAKIQFPDSELAQESVLPKFEDPEPVKSRNVETAGKIEPSLFIGWTLNDAFVEPLSIGGLLTYHFNEIHAAQLFGIKFSEDKNEYPDQILAETNGAADIRNTVAIPKPAYLLAYQWTPFYGKISFTKQSVVNLSIYGDLGLGQIQIDEDSEFAYSFGVGTKLYFGSRFNVRVDYRFLLYNARNQIDASYGDDFQNNSILSIAVGALLF